MEEREWRWADPVAAVRFLLSIRLNGIDPEVIGASLCEFGLIPDFDLLDEVAKLPARIAKNLECVRTLTLSTKSERARVLELKLSESAFPTKLGAFLRVTGRTREACSRKSALPSRGDWEIAGDAGPIRISEGIFTACAMVQDESRHERGLPNSAHVGTTRVSRAFY